ncbi:hypothetical protein [Raoultella terrigena]|uniref:hypothetical protein n=1 Tax=Raoultella terrigena TaxID=577 RepID=UPI001588A2CC|nr:hypothetical protein [Raoultella terrigena]
MIQTPVEMNIIYPPHKHQTTRLRAFITWALANRSATEEEKWGDAPLFLPIFRLSQSSAALMMVDGVQYISPYANTLQISSSVFLPDKYQKHL